MSIDEIMKLADSYVGSPYREGTTSHEAYLRQTRADLLKALKAGLCSADPPGQRAATKVLIT